MEGAVEPTQLEGRVVEVSFLLAVVVGVLGLLPHLRAMQGQGDQVV